MGVAGVLAGTSCSQECGQMQDMRQAHAQKTGQGLLLEHLQGSCVRVSEDFEAHSVRVLPSRIQAVLSSDSFLQHGLQEQSPFEGYDWEGKSEIQGWHEQWTSVHSDENSSSRKGQLCLRRLQGSREANLASEERLSGVSFQSRYPSHQRRQDKQPDFQSGDAVHGVSHEAPQISCDTVSMVRKVCTRGVRVYDIQVEGCHNFFASSLLTHNCLLIDDPFKNSEEANSELIREKKWDWFRTAAYTRLEPDGVIIIVATRWHELDITGRLLEEMKNDGEHWALLHLPALSNGKEVKAQITLPSEAAARLKIANGESFPSLAAYLQHVA